MGRTKFASKPTGLTRFIRTYTLTMDTTTNLTQSVPYSMFAGGQVKTPAAWTAANIGFLTCESDSGTFVIAKDYLGSPIQISGITTDSERAYQIPDEIFGAAFLKLWSKSTTAATETTTAQDDARTLIVVLKG